MKEYVYTLNFSMASQTKVQKWGNSYGVRIPRDVARHLGVEPGSPLNVEMEDGALILRTPKQDKSELDTLVAQITPDNRHEEIDWGEPRGQEIW